jgi:hypothetical protein
MGLELEPAAVRIHQGMALAALDLLAAIVASDPSALRCLDALAVHHGRGRAGSAADPLAVTHD